jgi:tripartite-type tricarboxylate transporter receptor subunit TctC
MSRKFVLMKYLFWFLGLMLGATQTCFGQADYPNKSITIVVPYAPGGQGDVFARLIAERLSTRLKQPVVVDNKPGATGALGTRIVAKAAGDGYTLLLGQTGEIAVNQSVVKSLGYDPVKDLSRACQLTLHDHSRSRTSCTNQAGID